eukprot:COSAG02_NODE_65734_length_257_cov_0.658228_1_plen_44_part_10
MKAVAELFGRCRYDDALEKGVSLHDSADGSGKPVGMWGLHEWHP